jgi:hypothetical protein
LVFFVAQYNGERGYGDAVLSPSRIQWSFERDSKDTC